MCYDEGPNVACTINVKFCLCLSIMYEEEEKPLADPRVMEVRVLIMM